MPIAGLGQPIEELQERVATILQGCSVSGCHVGPTPQMELDLRRDRFMMAVGRHAITRPDLQLIHPGQPDESYLVMKVEGADGIIGQRMPFDGEPLAEDDIATIREWVRRLGEEDAIHIPEPPVERHAFLGWRAVNLPTDRHVTPRTLLVSIAHRFNPRFDTGYDTFFGLDGSSVIFLSLGLGITDRLLVNLGRSNIDADVELNASYLILRQDDRSMPLSLAARGAVNWLSERPLEGSRLRGEAFKLTTQVILTRAFAGDRGGVALVPGVLFNPAIDEQGEPPLFTLGAAGRWRFRGNMSVLAEWVPIVTGYAQTSTFGNVNRFDSWGGGLEIATAGHVFQIVVTNSVGIATDQYLRGGDLDIRDGHFRLGFNIFRLINL